MSAYSFQGRKRLWRQRNEAENHAIFSPLNRETGIKMPNDFKPIYISKHIKNVAEKWSVQQLMRLLRYYRAHRCLWHPNDPDNRNRKLRKVALIDITAAMGDNIKLSEIIQKINVLRATYRYEKRRIKKRIRQGIGAKTKLRWFALADSFLRNVPKTEKFRRNEDDDSDSDLDNTLVVTVDPEALMPFDNVTNNAERQCKAENEAVTNDLSKLSNAHTQQSQPSDFSKESSEVHSETKQKLRWTAEHSLKFVKLLAKHTILWNITNQSLTERQNNTLHAIANALNLPFEFVLIRLCNFWHVFETDQNEMLENKTYIPKQYLWWPLAEQLIFNKQRDRHFVKLQNVTSNSELHELEISEVSAPESSSDAETAINPIPSVAPPSVSNIRMQDDIDELFYNDETSNVDANVHVQDDSNTKLIWNGLDDDLLEGKWSLKHSVKFLRLYGAHRCLWNLNDTDYRSRELRNAAIKDIAAAMGYGLDEAYVAKKIKIFRITYMQHRKRMLAAIMAGKKPEIQLRWFPLADSFLRPHIGLRSIKHRQREMPQFDLQYVYANLNLIDPTLLNDLTGKGTQNTINIAGAGAESRADR